MADGLRMVLWADDDGEESFEYESDILSTAGYEVAWANNVAEAIGFLTERPVAGVLLDQMLPVIPARRGPNDVDTWSGCLLVHWLRGRPLPKTAPDEARRSFLAAVAERTPHPGNDRVPVQIVSAYYEQAIVAALEALGTDGLCENDIIAKPVEEQLLRAFVDGLKGGGVPDGASAQSAGRSTQNA
jgi:CheY-like chemotaxis protein